MNTLNLVGIFAEEKNVIFIKKYLKNKLNDVEIIYFTKDNLENFKNVKFETILLINKITNITEKIEIVKKIINNAENIMVNCDIKENIDIIGDLKINGITFEFNTKASITTSSIQENEILICIQRNIKGVKNNIIEEQEIKVESENYNIEKNAINLMASVGLMKLYDCL